MLKHYINRQAVFLTFIIFSFFCSSVKAQYISGPTSVALGSTATYSISGVSSFCCTGWDVQGGHMVTQSPNGGSQVVEWNYPATNIISVDFRDGFSNYHYLELAVNVVGTSVTTPIISAVTQPTCTYNRGSFTITNYNAAYSYTANPSFSVVFSGSYVDAPIGTYTITASSGSSSATSSSVTINGIRPTPNVPIVESVIQPTHTTATGSVVLSNLPTSGTWVINPGNISGTGFTTTITGLMPNTATNFTVTNSSQCTSAGSAVVVINPQPTIPIPTLSLVTQPTCANSLGSYTITNYNATYVYSASPSIGVTISGSTVSAPTGNYIITATKGGESASSANIVVNSSPVPATPIISAIYQPISGTNNYGVVTLSGLPNGNWVINPGNISGSGQSIDISNLAANQTYNFTVTNSSGCTSIPTGNVVISSYTNCGVNDGIIPSFDPVSNWTHEISYDINGNVIGLNRSYFNDLGKSYLSLSKDMVSGKVWGSETLYDDFSRPFKNSFTEISPNCSLDKIKIFDTSRSSFYSDNNSLEPYQATATHPYSETNYDVLNPGNVINTVGGNKINGDWKTGYSYTVPAAQEMYYVYGLDYYDGTIISGKEEVITKFFKSVGVDANGVENVAFSDGEGKVLASARSGGATSYPVVSLIGTQGFVDVHIPAGISSVQIALIGSTSLYKVYNLKTGLLESGTLTGGNGYRIEAITPPTSDPKVYITSGVPTYDAGALGISYRVNYYDFAVNVYNKTGQLIKAIQPNGFQLNSTVVAQPAHMSPTATNFISTYTYNDQGQLKQVVSPDEGTSKFAYRQDGQIRYSQSALQADTKVSYTNYDSYGRPIESGVISNTTGIWTTANTNADTAALIGTVAQRSEQTFTVYDDPSNNTQLSVVLPANLTLNSVLTAEGISTTNYIQNNLSGNVAITYTKPGTTITAITWYSYDIYGRSEWMVQYNEGLGTKTIHYNYDYKGNVSSVVFQKDKTAEQFTHKYTYNANSVLTKVETATYGTPFVTHADYSYYLTGELKRVNIAQGLQGLDYVYTLGGQLKSINHPSLEAAKDPGGDTNDVFGITLDYYSGDYLRTGRNITASPTISADYNGNIKAARWATKSTSMDLSGSTINQKGYLYNYDRNNWLTGATFGNTNASTAAIAATTSYKEAGLTYDANGNIKTLQRTNNTGVTVDNLTYNYTNTGKNQLNSITESAAVTADITDIENQAAGNYVYNVIGQLERNVLENLYYIYNTQGLVIEVKKGTNTMVKFFYNERGQRIKKESYSNGSLQSTTYYALDLSGNTMAVYNKPAASGMVQTDLPIYGLSRLGVYTRANATSSYEITDHLGNVRAVIQKVNGNPQIQSYADYYPFGEQLPMRNSLSNYRYAFQGQELDGETGMEAFQLRLWDGRIGRWLSPDPMGQYASPYLGMGNNPINSIDPDGGWETKFGAWWHGLWDGKNGTVFQSEIGDWGIRYEGTYNSDGVIAFAPNFGGTRYYGNSNSSNYSWQIKDPFPNSKWRWFDDRLSGYGQYGGNLRSGFIGDYVGAKGEFYGWIDSDWVTPGSGGTKFKFIQEGYKGITSLKGIKQNVQIFKDYFGAYKHGDKVGKAMLILTDEFSKNKAKDSSFYVHGILGERHHYQLVNNKREGDSVARIFSKTYNNVIFE